MENLYKETDDMFDTKQLRVNMVLHSVDKLIADDIKLREEETQVKERIADVKREIELVKEQIKKQNLPK